MSIFHVHIANKHCGLICKDWDAVPKTTSTSDNTAHWPVLSSRTPGTSIRPHLKISESCLVFKLLPWTSKSSWLIGMCADYMHVLSKSCVGWLLQLHWSERHNCHQSISTLLWSWWSNSYQLKVMLTSWTPTAVTPWAPPRFTFTTPSSDLVEYAVDFIQSWNILTVVCTWDSFNWMTVTNS